jgi:antitoxin VapB
MQTAKLFVNGRSQAVRLPRDCRFAGADVYVKKFENLVILFSKTDPWASLVRSLGRFTEDFMGKRSPSKSQKRERF